MTFGICLSAVGPWGLYGHPCATKETDAHWTYADYKDWELKPGERYEIIYGEAYAMSAPNAYHQAILTETVRQGEKSRWNPQGLKY